MCMYMDVCRFVLHVHVTYSESVSVINTPICEMYTVHVHMYAKCVQKKCYSTGNYKNTTYNSIKNATTKSQEKHEKKKELGNLTKEYLCKMYVCTHSPA